MRRVLIAAIIALAMLTLGAGAGSAFDLSSQIYIGPGGVQVGDGHERRRSHRRRGSEGYDEHDRRRSHRRSGSEGGYHGRYQSERVEAQRLCARLRRACMFKDERGEVGEGNCRRYRRTCQ